MKTVRDERFEREAARFSLRWACEDCCHFAHRGRRGCGNGWPIELRAAPGDGDAPMIAFCKEFEMS